MRCDTSQTAELRGEMSSWVTDSFATLEETSWRSVSRSWFSLMRADSWVMTVSSWVGMATMPDTVAHSMEIIDPSLTVMVGRAWGDRSWTRLGEGGRLFLVSAKTSASKVRAEMGRLEGKGEGGSWMREVLAREMAAAKPWLPGAMGGIPIRGQSEKARCQELSRKQSGACAFVKCRWGKVEGEELDPNHSPFVFFLFLFLFLLILFIMRSLFLGTRSFVQR